MPSVHRTVRAGEIGETTGEVTAPAARSGAILLSGSALVVYQIELRDVPTRRFVGFPCEFARKQLYGAFNLAKAFENVMLRQIKVIADTLA